MEIRILKARADRYFDKYKGAQVTLAGFTRALDFEEGDLDILLSETAGRKAILDVYLKLAEILETQANIKPSSHRTEMLKSINKFVGGLYSFDKSTTQRTLKTKEIFADLEEDTQKKLMQAIANREK